MITYNAGKFLLDGNEIINPDVLQFAIEITAPLEGHRFALPATLRAEVEYQTKTFSPDWEKTNEWACGAYQNQGHLVRKVVRLVEVESKYRDQSEFETEEEYFNHCRIARSTGILAVGLPDYEPAFPEPDKQAIDERVELNVLELARAYANLQKIDYPVHNGHKAAIKAQIREAFYSGYESSQPPPQAESQWISVKDRLPEKNGLYIIHKTADPNRSIEWLIDVVFYCKEAPFNRFVTHWMPLPTPPINPKH